MRNRATRINSELIFRYGGSHLQKEQRHPFELTGQQSNQGIHDSKITKLGLRQSNDTIIYDYLTASRIVQLYIHI